MKIVRAVMCSVILGILHASALQAQRDKPYEFADLDGVWGRVELRDNSIPAVKLNAAGQAISFQKRDAIFEILKNSRALQPFKGFALRADKGVVGYADSTGNTDTRGPIRMIVGMTVGHFIRNARTGQVEPFYIEMPRIEIQTNNLSRTPPTWDANKFWYEGLRDEQGREFYLEPHATARTDGGLDIYRLDAWTEEVLVTNGRPVWIPATSEQFLRAMINYARKMRADEIENARSSGGVIPETQSGPMQFLRSYEKELAALPPAERLQPAYYLRNVNDPLQSGLVKAGTQWSRLVVTPNPDYLDRTLPRTAVQLISCLYNYNLPYGSDEPEKPSISLRTLNGLARHLEYEKLAALIDR